MLGYRFTPLSSGWIVGAAWLESVNDSGSHTCQLRTEDATPLKQFTWTPSPSGAFEGAWVWTRRRMYPGWFVEQGTVYQWMVGFQIPTYAYEHSVLTSPLDSGSIRVKQNNYDGSRSAGIFWYGYPFEADAVRADETLYGVDMLFQPASY